MILHRLEGSFGCLNQRKLRFDQGINLMEAPNESGKSTFCAFLVVMLYGMNTKERDKKGSLAEKNRYRPFSGVPMEGLLEVTVGKRRMILRRSSRGNSPMTVFSAVDAETQIPINELTGENAGELLTGVTREVFERTVLLRQTKLSVEPSGELEKRIAALLTTGQEGLSWTQVDGRLREWQRSRRYQKSGQIGRASCRERVYGLV